MVNDWERTLDGSLRLQVGSEVDLVLNALGPRPVPNFRERHDSEERFAVGVGIGQYHEHEDKPVAGCRREVILGLGGSIEEPVESYIQDLLAACRFHLNHRDHLHILMHIVDRDSLSDRWFGHDEIE